MLKKIYIHNFRCFENFELELDKLNLFIGDNGVGKSSLFHLLHKIQSLINGTEKVSSLFSPDDLTLWQKSDVQTFGIEIEGNKGLYEYKLMIKHEETKQRARILQETLLFNSNPLLKFDAGEVQFYQDDNSASSVYPFDWNQSAVASLPARADNTRITWFRERLQRFVIVQIIPMLMKGDSIIEESRLDYNMANYVSWYRFIYQNQGKAIKITNALTEVLEGFNYFEFIKTGEMQRILRLSFLNNNREYFYRFNQLSDGQRMLIALYALIFYARSEDYTLCIDEPQSFVTLAEIQPWLMLMEKFCDDGELQTLVISHHPEVIDYLALSCGNYFSRQVHTPTQVKRVKTEDNSGLPVSELIASGWFNE
jgi:predicted ATPase